MKTRNECKECGYFWWEENATELCPECASIDILHETVINFLEQKGSHSPSRTVCYSYKDGVITGRSPEKIITPGIILTGIPYNNLQKSQFLVKDVEYRPHSGEYSELWFWEARCEATQ